MAIKINFDTAHNPEEPTFILAKKNGDKLGKINAVEIEVSDKLNDAPEISFTVNKYANDVKEPLWDEVINFRLVYCVEWNKWFEITVELDESSETKKTVSGVSLGQAELSQINLYNIQINTEDDIARDAYVVPTVLYRKNGNLTAEEQRMASKILKKDVYYLDDYKSASLLHRITEKCPHYSIAHVDETIASIQRTFEFNETSIYDAFQDIANEINCLFVLDSDSDENGNIRRTIAVYDLESNCLDCGHRDEFTMICPKCGSKNINEGYGDDTGIFVSSDELAESIQLSVDTDQVKNCFKLEAGDDDVTAAVRICNPNGSDYIWHITDATKKDMSKELVDSIAAYDKEYARYYNEVDYYPRLNAENVTKYNELVEKYNKLIEASGSGENEKFEVDEKLSTIPTSIVGYQKLMNIYYDTIDFKLYLNSSLMPTAKLSDTDAEKEAAKLTKDGIGDVGASSLSGLTTATARSLVLSMAKVVVDYRYKVEVADGDSLNSTNNVWTGKFIVANYSDEDDTAESSEVSIQMTADAKTFTKQKLEKTLAKGDNKDVSISGIFAEKDIDVFKAELRKYSFKRLESFKDSCQSCLEIMTEQGIPDEKTWSTNKDGETIYKDLYLNYYNKLAAIEAEMNLRSSEILIISGKDEDGNVKTKGMMEYIEDIKSDVQDKLNFEKSLGEDLWCEMCSFRREDKYSNSNYTSDGLNNAQLIKRANEFIEEANKDIYKSAEQQHSISADLNNLLVIEKFKPLVKSFEVGNFIRVMVDDELYKLRLIEYTIDYDDIEKISVDFSDAVSVASTMKTVKDVLDQASSMATSYDSVKRQAEKGSSSNAQLSDWVNKGLSLTNMKIVGNADNQNITWDSHGILCREYMPESDDYNNKQLKIINRGLYTTTDNWETTKAGIGNFIYYDPRDGTEKEGYGVIADTLVSNLILSEDVGIYNKNNSITLNKDGFVISTKATGDTGANDKVFTIQKEYFDSDNQKQTINLMHVDNTGNLVLNGSLKVENTTLSGLGTTATDYLTYENGVLNVGASGSGYTAIDSNGVKIYNNSKYALASFTNTEAVVGKVIINGTKYYNTQITDSAINFRNGKDVLTSVDGSGMKIYSGGNVVGSFGSSSITLGGSNTTSITMAGSATLNVSSLSIGGVTINSWDDIDDDTGQYVLVNPTSGYGIAVTSSANSINVPHVQIKSDGLYLKNNSSTELASFKNGEVNIGVGTSTINLCGSAMKIYADSEASYIEYDNNTWFGIGSGYLALVPGGNVAITMFVGSGTYVQGYIELQNKVRICGNAEFDRELKGYDDIIAVGRLKTEGAATGDGENVVMHSAGWLRKESSSSRRYKHDIKDISDDLLNPDNLYDIPVRQFVFNDGYLAEGDAYEGVTVPGFIAEEVYEHYPVAVRHENGLVENWNARYIIPPMLALIQKQHKQIDELAEKVNALISTQ